MVCFSTPALVYCFHFFLKEYPKRKKQFTRYGNWGVCFIYGSWFALGGLAAAGKTYNNCLAIHKAVEFLLNSQFNDGGWGESYISCPAKASFTCPILINNFNLIHFVIISYLVEMHEQKQVIRVFDDAEIYTS